MKVVLLSLHYPPDPAVGSVRVGRVAAAFAAAGHEVDVVAVRLGGGRGDAPEGEPGGSGIRVHRVRRLPNAREIALALRDRVRPRRRPAGSGAPQVGWLVPENVPGWKRFLVAMALLPDGDQGFVLPAVGRSLGLIRGGADLLYTSGPPHSAHVAGILLKRLTGVRWAAEFRDPWTDYAVRPRYAVSETADRVKRWLERRTLAAADHIVVVSEAVLRLFEAKTAGVRPGRVLLVRNGIPAGRPVPRLRAGDGVRVVYLGNLYHGRDPRPFLEALAALREVGDDRALRTEVDFYGDCRTLRGMPMQGFIDQLGLGAVVRLHPPVARDQVPGLMSGADVLLLLAQGQPLQVPAKLYEYLAARRPILAFVDDRGESAAMLRRLGGHHIACTAEADAVRAVVRQALEGTTPGEAGMDESVLAEWSADRQMAKLVASLASPR